MADAWTIKRFLDWCKDYLGEHGDESSLVSAQLLVSQATGLSRIELYMNYDRILSADELDQLRPWVKRRGAGEPLQYILGTAPFRYLDIKVRPGVLIPRPETEVLVSEVLAALPAAERRVAADSLMNEYDGAAAIEERRVAESHAEKRAPAETVQDFSMLEDEFAEEEPVEQPGDAVLFGARAEDDFPDGEDASGADAAKPCESEELGAARAVSGLLVADICTGSGCIACALATERDDVRVLATDLSPEAAALARENVQACGAVERVGVLVGDLGAPIEAARPQFMGVFDAVVSNPPYVPSDVVAALPSEVADYEPALALDGGADGLDIYRRLLPWAGRALRPGGVFACELHETCLDEAARLARDAGMADVRIVQDLTHRPRVLVCKRA